MKYVYSVDLRKCRYLPQESNVQGFEGNAKKQQGIKTL